MAEVDEGNLSQGGASSTPCGTSTEELSGRNANAMETPDIMGPPETVSNAGGAEKDSEDIENLESACPPSDESAAPSNPSTSRVPSTTPSEPSTSIELDTALNGYSTSRKPSSTLSEQSTSRVPSTTPSEPSTSIELESAINGHSTSRKPSSTPSEPSTTLSNSPKSIGKQVSLPTIDLDAHGNLEVRTTSLETLTPGVKFSEIDVPRSVPCTALVSRKNTQRYKTSKELRAEYILISLKNRGRNEVSARSTLPARLNSRKINLPGGQQYCVDSNAPSNSASTSRMDISITSYSSPQPEQIMPETSDSFENTIVENVIPEDSSGSRENETTQVRCSCDLSYLFTCGSFLKFGTVITCLAMSVCAILLWQCPREILARTRYLIATGFIASTSATECMSSLFMFVMMVIAVGLFIDRFCHLEKQAVMATAVYGCCGCFFLAADFLYLLVQRIAFDQNAPNLVHTSN